MVQSTCETGGSGQEAHHEYMDDRESTNSTTRSYETKVTDLDLDSLVLCASNLSLHDLTNMAMTCQRFRDAAYSDTVWEIQCRLFLTLLGRLNFTTSFGYVRLCCQRFLQFSIALAYLYSNLDWLQRIYSC